VRERVTRVIKGNKRLTGIAFEHRIELSIGESEVRFWSPQIVAAVSPTADGGSLIVSRFGPDPYVWGFYVLAYGALIIVTLFATIYGIVQWSLGQPPVALFVAPGAAVLAALVFGASFVGQGLGVEQMYFLRSTLTEAVEGEETELPKAD
jgi:hypothetical protein